jgi:hypothetical protein
VKGQDVIHHGWLAKVGTGNEFGLLSDRNGGIDQNIVPKFGADIAGFTVFENVDDQPDRTMASMTGFAGFAIQSWDADQPGRSDGGSLRTQLRQWRY